jgi:putative oxidoreductase
MNHVLGRDGAKDLSKDAALVPTRAALGTVMLYHGWDKLRSDRREQAAQSFEGMGIRPGRFWAITTGVAETLAGALSLAGVFTRAAAVAVLVTQAVAIAKVHGRKGFPATKGGYEYNLTLIAAAATLLLAGSGRFSTAEAVLGRAVRRRRRGLLAHLLA